MNFNLDENDLVSLFDKLEPENNSIEYSNIPTYSILGNTILLNDGSKIIFEAVDNVTLDDIIIINKQGKVIFLSHD